MENAEPGPKPAIERALRAADYAAARALCEAAVQNRETADFYPLTLARLAYVEGRRGETLRRLGRLVRTLREPATWARVGELYEALGRLAAAERCLRRALVVDPSPRPLHRLLDMLRHQGRHAEGDELRDDVLLARFADDAWGLQDRAARLFAEGRHAEALAIYERLSSPFDAYACAEICLRQDNDADALRWCRRAAVPQAPQPWAHYRAAQILARRGEIEAALRCLAEAPGGQALAETRARLLDRCDPARAATARAAMLGPIADLVAARLDALRGGRLVLHGYRDRHGWRVLRVRPVLYFRPTCDRPAWRAMAHDAVARLAAFHQREFGPHPGFAIEPFVEREGPRPYDFFRHAVEHRAFRAVARDIGIRQRRKYEVVLIFWCGEDVPLQEGYGGYGYAALRCALDDAYAATVVTHEFYHASLGLQHTDGDKDILDGGGIMGDPGGMNRLEETWVHPRQRAMCATPPRALALTRRGDRLEDDSRWDEAAACYREAVRLDPLYVWPAARLAQVEVHRGRYGEAEAVLRRLLEIDPAQDPTAQLAHVLLDQGRVSEAARVLAAMRGAGTERGQLMAGFVWGMSWYYPRAMACFRAALALQPASMAARGGLAAVSSSLGRMAEARRHYHRALEADPHWAEACDRLAVVEAEDGHLDEAWRLLARSARLKRPGGLHHWARARVHGIAGRWDLALASIRRSLDIEPHTIGALLFEPWVLVLLGRPEEAQAGFERCRDSENRSPCGRVAAAWADIVGGRPLERHRAPLRRLYARDQRLGALVHARALIEEDPALWRRLDQVEPGSGGFAAPPPNLL